MKRHEIENELQELDELLDWTKQQQERYDYLELRLNELAWIEAI